MGLFKWLFGKKKKIPLRLMPKELRGEFNIFLIYVSLFNEKRIAVERLDGEWFRGNINLIIYRIKQILAILKKEYAKERASRRIAEWILQNRALPESELPEISKIEDIINQLIRNLESQLKLFNEFLEHQDFNRLHRESHSLIEEEEKLLFSEREVLENLLKALERRELAIELSKARKTEYNVWMTSIDKVQEDLDFKFEDIIPYLRTLGLPIRILDLGCDVGVSLKQLYDRYGTSIELHGIGIKREPLWKLGLRETIRKAWGRPGVNIEFILSHFPEKKTWDPNAITWHIGHAGQLSRIFNSEFFSFIYSHHGIMHAYDIIKALNECHKVLKKGGIIAFDVGEQQKLKILSEQKSFEIIHVGKGLAPTGQPTEILHLRKLHQF